jgi:hypothetical protein
MDHLQVVTRLSDELYRNAWVVLGEFWERGAGRDHIITVGTMDPGFSGGLALVICSALCSLKIGTTLMLGV